jgi:hypothetical protein
VLLHPTQDDTKMTTAVMALMAWPYDFLAKNNIGQLLFVSFPLRIEDVANMAWLSVDLV